MSRDEKDTKKDLDAQRKEKLREELEKQPKTTSKGRTQEDITTLQQQYEDAKKEKLKREMALQKYENDFLNAKVPKEKMQELDDLIEKIENKEGKQAFKQQKEENIKKKIALEKEIAQIMEQHRPLLLKELENKDSEFTKGYVKLVTAIDEQSKKVTEARLKFEGIDERPLITKKSPQNPVEAYETRSIPYNYNKNVESSYNVKSTVKDLNLSNVERFLKGQYKDNKYKLNPTSQQLEITLKNKSTITLEKNKISTSSESKEDQLLMIQMYLEALVKEGKDLSKTTLTANCKDPEKTEWLQTQANDMKNKFIEQQKKGEFNLTSEDEPEDKLELAHKEAQGTTRQPDKTEPPNKKVKSDTSTESEDESQRFRRSRSGTF